MCLLRAEKYTATRCNTPQHTIAHRNTPLQHIEGWWSTRRAPCKPDSTLHHNTLPHCNTPLQHTEEWYPRKISLLVYCIHRHTQCVDLAVAALFSACLCLDHHLCLEAPCNTTHCNTLHHTATHCSTTHCNTLQHTATQNTATHCNTLQHNTLQHTAPPYLCLSVS